MLKSNAVAIATLDQTADQSNSNSQTTTATLRLHGT